jgi:hypothetical protein
VLRGSSSCLRGSNPLTRTCFQLLFGVFLAAEFLVLLIGFERPAYAYADPGSGLLFLQVVTSMFAGGLFLVRSKLKKLLHLGRPETAEQTGANELESGGQ